MYLSKVIKSGEALPDIEPFLMERLEEAFEEDEVIEEAQPIEPVVAANENVGTDLEELERQAYEKGFTAGEKAGLELGKQKAEVLFNSLSSILNELSAFKETLFKACEKEMLELSLAVAKKVIHRETEISRDVVLESVKAALNVAVASGEILIKVNPKDLETVFNHKSDLARFGEGVKGVTIEGDESIGKGGCIIETNYGEVDATTTGLLEEIEERLRNA